MPATNSPQGWKLENSYATLPAHFYTALNPTPVRAPRLIIINTTLAASLGLDFSTTDDASLAQLFSGNILPENASPLAQAYAGHQFGNFTLLGDGRAHLIGEHIAPDGTRYDIQLKGSGRTPYSRRGDGRAALAPMLREYIISEAMHALGIPTTRSLAVVTTGETVIRQTELQGAILTRVAASHLRVGTFEYAAAKQDRAGLKSLADYAISRHYPHAATHENPYRALLESVIQQQATLIAAWMCIGFVHGVMNTDNMTISGETIDYGPCAFMDQFSMGTVFSSIDHQGRYAFGNQPTIAHWNLSRLAETLLPLLHEHKTTAIDVAEECIAGYSEHFQRAWLAGMSKKLGILNGQPDDVALVQNLLEWMQAAKADYTNTFRDLIAEQAPQKALYQDAAFLDWHTRWQTRLNNNDTPIATALSLMRESNPVIIPRNHHVEEALDAAEDGNMQPFQALLHAVQHPYSLTADNAPYRDAPQHPNPNYQTFCGT
jgi:uncharacterized protein YdiU (UPF0061 family)